MTRGKKTVLYVLGFVLLALVGISTSVVLQLVELGEPTTGPAIDTYPHPRSALVVIDVQEDFTGPDARWPYADGDRLVEEVNHLIVAAASRKMEVVYIRNEHTDPPWFIKLHGMNLAGDPLTAIDSRINRVNDRVFTKSRGDAFSNPDLERHLVHNQVDHVYLVGLDAAQCVTSTARGALNRGYAVSIVRDAVITASDEPIDVILEPLRTDGATIVDGSGIKGR